MVRQSEFLHIEILSGEADSNLAVLKPTALASNGLAGHSRLVTTTRQLFSSYTWSSNKILNSYIAEHKLPKLYLQLENLFAFGNKPL